MLRIHDILQKGLPCTAHCTTTGTGYDLVLLIDFALDFSGPGRSLILKIFLSGFDDTDEMRRTGPSCVVFLFLLSRTPQDRWKPSSDVLLQFFFSCLYAQHGDLECTAFASDDAIFQA